MGLTIRSSDKDKRSFMRSRLRPQFGGDGKFDERHEMFDASLDDGIDEELKKSCREFFKQSDEIYEEDYAFRPDVNFREGEHLYY
jgi:hypothetical protein